MNNNTIHIRRVEQADMPFLLNFEQNLIAAERPFNPTFISDTFHYYDLPRLMNDDNSIVLAGVYNDQLVPSGYATLKPGKHYEAFDRYAYLGFMYVAPDHRGKGINQLMMQEFAQWALTKGVTEMRLLVYEQNKPAINAYQKAGFEPLMMQMRADARDIQKDN